METTEFVTQPPQRPATYFVLFTLVRTAGLAVVAGSLFAIMKQFKSYTWHHYWKTIAKQCMTQRSGHLRVVPSVLVLIVKIAPLRSFVEQTTFDYPAASAAFNNSFAEVRDELITPARWAAVYTQSVGAHTAS